jgi:copper(I)-binding protein
MKQSITKILILVVSLFLISACKAGNTSQETGIVLEGPWIRLVPSSSTVTGGYVKITNHDKDDRLISASANISKVVELHYMIEENGVMKMRKFESGIEIPSHKTVTLQPGGNHIMFIDLVRPLVDGEQVLVSLEFEKAGKKELSFTVKDAQAMPMH